MKRNFAIYCLLALATILGLNACSEPSNSIPAGMGQVEIYLTAPYHKGTRASGDWLDPVSDNEMIHEYWVAFVNNNSNSDNYKKVEWIARGNAGGTEEHSFRFFLPPGDYAAYAFANMPETEYTSATSSLQFSSSIIKVYTPKEATEEDPSTFVITPLPAITKGEAMPDLTNARLATNNGWTGNIPMSSNINGQAITVVEAENQSFEIELIRTMAKMEFTFLNSTQQNLYIDGFEISPLAKENYVSLLEPRSEPDDEHPIFPAILAADETESYAVNLKNSPFTPLYLHKKVEGAPPFQETAPIFYVNETNASAISTEEPNKNQYSIRIKVRRSGESSEVEEFRYGFTVNTGIDLKGFDYIRRNDWIKIPIDFNDWTFRVEALPFPPIAGFQARVLSADALSITFNSGGYIFLRPMFRKNDDPEGVWRGFDDSDVIFKLTGEYTEKASNVVESIDTETGTGIVLTGDLNIFEQRFVQLESGDIVGKLTNDDDKNGQVTLTIKLILGGFAYQFNYNILKQ